MQQAVEGSEILKAQLVENARKVEFDIGLAADERGVAEQAQGLAIGHHAPEDLGPVQVLLHEGMGGQAGPARRRGAA